MKRDMDLIRLRLLQIEGEEPKPDLSGYTQEQIIYHSALLIEAELVKGIILPDPQSYPTSTVVIRLTWKGHEFLDAARNDTIWKKAGAQIKKAGGQITLALLEELLKKLGKDALGLQ